MGGRGPWRPCTACPSQLNASTGCSRHPAGGKINTTGGEHHEHDTNARSGRCSPGTGRVRDIIHADSCRDIEAGHGPASGSCQKIDTLEEFSALVDQAKNLYGNPMPMTSFKAHIAGGMARVTCTYMITAINQADQPWTLEAGGWRDDNC